jgi:hypothetical protein
MGGRRLGLIEFAGDLAQALSLLVLWLDLEHEFVASTCRPLRRAFSAGSYSRGSRTSTGSPFSGRPDPERDNFRHRVFRLAFAAQR